MAINALFANLKRRQSSIMSIAQATRVIALSALVMLALPLFGQQTDGRPHKPFRCVVKPRPPCHVSHASTVDTPNNLVM